MIAIIGLGNPGKEYENTYHNMGYIAIDAFAREYGFNFTKTKYNGMFAEGRIANEKVVLLKPTTYMNLSGQAVVQLVNALKIPTDNILVVYDDIDLPMGEIRIRKKGSAGTHNGMRNIIQLLGSDAFSRLRIGIGRDERMDLKDYVLSKVTGEKLTTLTAELPKIVKVMNAFVEFKGDTERIDVNNY